MTTTAPLPPSPAVPLERLEPGTLVLVGGDRAVPVGEELAAAWQPGDALLGVAGTGELLHVPAAERAAATTAVDAAVTAFSRMGEVTDAQVTDFYAAFAARLEDDATFASIAAANAADVARAKEAGRSTTRLELSPRMRADMVAGLRGWRDAPATRGRLVGDVRHDGWRVELTADRLGVVGFVFEGRPNVVADATGVLRGGNTVVFRIGRDALGTARAIAAHALLPALAEVGLPEGAVSLVDSPSRAAGWALFSDPRLALAVARGSGAAVHTLGSVARQSGIPVSLHGTGGAWLVASAAADATWFAESVRRSLDRKVCNTLNTCCVVADRADELVAVVVAALGAAAVARGTAPKLHVTERAAAHLPAGWLDRQVTISRADGDHTEAKAEPIGEDGLGREWEWESSPEVTLAVVDDVDEAVRLFNAHSPRLVISLVSDDDAEHARLFATAEAPFVGNGFTRWVDGQYALNTPELGLSNWEHGRLFARGGVLSGDGVFTVRTRAIFARPDIDR